MNYTLTRAVVQFVSHAKPLDDPVQIYAFNFFTEAAPQV